MSVVLLVVTKLAKMSMLRQLATITHLYSRRSGSAPARRTMARFVGRRVTMPTTFTMTCARSVTSLSAAHGSRTRGRTRRVGRVGGVDHRAAGGRAVSQSTGARCGYNGWLRRA